MSEDTQSHPLLRDFLCPGCGLGTSRIGGTCLDCLSNPCGDQACE